MSASPKLTKIVIVGGGFGGVRVARQLARRSGLEITLISDRETFAYYPQLYHAATGGARSESSIPLTELLNGTGVKLVHDTVATLHPDQKTVTGVSGSEYHYDELVLALGAVTNYFGIAGLKDYAYNIKTIEGAEAFKAHLHKELIDDKKPELDYVVVGAGPTGVELSSALGQYLERITRLHGIKAPKYHIDLIEAAPRILPRSPEGYAGKVEQRLRKLGIRIMTGAVVEGETSEALQLKGKQIVSKTVVWTAGVANNPFFKENAGSFTLAANGRVEVDEHLETRLGAYVIGDNADTKFCGQAETAINDANFVAEDIMRKRSGASRRAYRQPQPASVIPVGTGWAAATYKGLNFYGYAGWILRRLGDLVAYHDVEDTAKAVSVWLAESKREHDCPVCRADERPVATT